MDGLHNNLAQQSPLKTYVLERSRAGPEVTQYTASAMALKRAAAAAGLVDIRKVGILQWKNHGALEMVVVAAAAAVERDWYEAEELTTT